ncbi:phosphatidylserine decarboxylase proenzyme, mitochondrial-like isoform X2 [Physella acuta]|uniref:phosphatidylserine decarboxylase proenzyme, mitochondrial-like isoform X2 n=1 Tax=Physella acuta TaxID=109671 RepID=UPI0027DCC4AE|nr:phosphatidylserine decarboxylase proenzyme, mitochondrial-like isoform X2 [Physella acuta]
MATLVARNTAGLHLCQVCYRYAHGLFVPLRTESTYRTALRLSNFQKVEPQRFLNPKNPVLSRRLLSDQNVQTKKKSLSTLSKFSLVVCGCVPVGYYVIHKMTTAEKPGKPWQINLYRRMPLKTLSRLWGKFNQMELPIFLRKPLLGLYIWMFGCNLEEAEIEDLKLYRNLGEFFRRQLKPHVRPIDDDHVLTSPADGKILYYGQVKNGILEQVKGVTYSLRGFLGPQTASGTCVDIHNESDEEFQKDLSLQPGNELHHVIIYLAPGDYHRFHSPATWTVEHRRHFPGELLSVNPGIARWVQGLFNFNERAVYTGRWEHGFFSMAAVGATNVGSIKIYCDEELETNTRTRHPEHTYFDKKFATPITIEKGDMFGEFNLGSTIVLIFEAPPGFKFKVHEGDKIKYGRPLGTTP